MFEAGRYGEDREASAIFVSTAGSAQRSRAVPFFVSLVLHVAGVTAAVSFDLFFGAPKSFQVRLPEQVIAESENRVLWYPLQRELPEVAPVKPATAASPNARARYRLPQTIVANDPNPDSGRQMILGPSPDIKVEQDIPSPNLLAWSAPRVSPLRFAMSEAAKQQPQQPALNENEAPAIQPSRPLPGAASQAEIRLRYRLAEREQAAPQERSLVAENTPRVPIAPGASLDVARLQKLDPLRYRMWEQTRPDPARPALPEAAPQVAAAVPAGLDSSAFSKTARLRYWMREGQAANGPAQSTLDVAPAPQVGAALPASASLAAMDPKTRLRYRVSESPAGEGSAATPSRRALGAGFDTAPGIGESTPPAGAEWAATEAVQALARVEAPRAPEPASTGDGQASSAGQPGGLSASGGDEPNVAVVGVDPDPNAPARALAGQRRGRFAASPDGGPGGGDQIPGPTETAAVRMPNLSIAGPATPPVASAVRSSSTGGLRHSPGASQRAWTCCAASGARATTRRRRFRRPASRRAIPASQTRSFTTRPFTPWPSTCPISPARRAVG